MYKVEYLPSADTDIEEAEVSLFQFSPSAADKFSESIETKTASLINFPFMYPVSKYDEDLRCIVLPYKYLLFYHVDEAAKLVQVYRVLHGMRDIPNIL